MKKFQKILSAGLILAQVCSSSFALGATNDSDKKPEVSVRVVSEKSSGILGTMIKWSKRIALGLALGEVFLQGVCAKCPGVALELSKYADTDNFKFSDYMKPSASLRYFEARLDSLVIEYPYLVNTLVCQEITGGWQQAAKIAALGFAKDIYVKRNGGTEFKFYYMPGDYGLTSVDACNYLQHLIKKIRGMNFTDPDSNNIKTATLDELEKRKKILKGCVSYEAWAKANKAVKTVKEKLPFSEKVKSKQPSKSKK